MGTNPFLFSFLYIEWTTIVRLVPKADNILHKLTRSRSNQFRSAARLQLTITALWYSSRNHVAYARTHIVDLPRLSRLLLNTAD